MTEVIAAGVSTPSELADRANAAHASVVNALHGALASAIACGEALLDAQRQIGTTNGWGEWARENLDFSPGMAKDYMRLATYKAHLPPEVFEAWTDSSGRTVQPSWTRAIAYLKTLDLPSRQRGPRIAESARAEIPRLHAQGLSETEIADALGIHKVTVWNHLNPDRARAHRLRVAERRKQEKRLLARGKKVAEEQELARIARTRKDALGRSYAALRRLLNNDLQRAHDEARGDARAALEAALSAMHAAEDAIGRALRASGDRR